MSKKSQFETQERNCFEGFLLIECLIALLVASWLMMLIATGQKKSMEGQTYVRQQFELIQKTSTLLHRMMAESINKETQKIRQGALEITVSPESYTVISSDPPLAWLDKKPLPIKPVKVTVKDKSKQKLSITTAVLSTG